MRICQSMAASMDLEVEKLDIKTTFLHGDFEEEMHMQQVEGFIKKGKENMVLIRLLEAISVNSPKVILI